MNSLRIRLVALWLMLAASAVVTSVLLWQFYRQTANAQIARAENDVVRGCRDITDRYAFFVAGWRGAGMNDIDETLKGQLNAVVQTALGRVLGVEGGIWQADAGSLAYAFPSYEGTGPKTDLPAAELPTIRQVNADALRSERPMTARQSGRSQVLIVHACPLPGPLLGLTGWTMTRAFTGEGGPYNQLLIGLTVLALTVIGSAIWLGRILVSWSRKLARLERALAGRQDADAADLPELPATGERELDRLVDALNATGQRLGEARRRAASSERLAAVGHVAAGVAHEIRNPIAAMRLRAENALASQDPARSMSALRTILEQVGRLDTLLRDLLNMTQRKSPQVAPVDVRAFLESAAEAHRELAATKGIGLQTGAIEGVRSANVDAGQIRQALDNLILNAIQNTPSGGSVTLTAYAQTDRLRLEVADTGPGVPDGIRDRLFEPFVTGRADGTGLGLAIVREIARAHGGESSFVSGPHGTSFRIELPWQPS